MTRSSSRSHGLCGLGGSDCTCDGSIGRRNPEGGRDWVCSLASCQGTWGSVRAQASGEMGVLPHPGQEPGGCSGAGENGAGRGC